MSIYKLPEGWKKVSGLESYEHECGARANLMQPSFRWGWWPADNNGQHTMRECTPEMMKGSREEAFAAAVPPKPSAIESLQQESDRYFAERNEARSKLSGVRKRIDDLEDAYAKECAATVRALAERDAALGVIAELERIAPQDGPDSPVARVKLALANDRAENERLRGEIHRASQANARDAQCFRTVITGLRADLARLQKQADDEAERERVKRWHVTYNASLTGLRASPGEIRMYEGGRCEPTAPGCDRDAAAVSACATVDADLAHDPLGAKRSAAPGAEYVVDILSHDDPPRVMSLRGVSKFPSALDAAIAGMEWMNPVGTLTLRVRRLTSEADVIDAVKHG